MKMINTLRKSTLPELLKIAEDVWSQRELFIRWPKKQLTLMPGVPRIRYHVYPPDALALLQRAGIRPNTLSNGPAVCAFRLADGERPRRNGANREWSVHHIYDGKFPAPGRTTTLHAVRDGRYFTDTA